MSSTREASGCRTRGRRTPVGRFSATSVELVSTSYDAAGALETLAETEFPMLEGWFGRTLRGEVTAEEATETFESRRRGA